MQTMTEHPIIREASNIIRAVDNKDGTALAWSTAAMAIQFARTHFADVLTAAHATDDAAVTEELRFLAIGLGEDPESEWWVDA